MNEIIDAWTEVTDAQLAALEARFRLKLPDEYRKFLGRSNGGTPVRKSFAESCVQYFLEVNGRDRHSDIEVRWNMLRDRLPEHMLPIADDPGGNSVLILTRGPAIGSIWFWDHENPDEPIFLNNSFDEFLSSLVESEFD